MNARIAILATSLSWVSASTAIRAADPLPSWNGTAPRKAIVAFVEKVTKEGRLRTMTARFGPSS
jgi:hypothetical protein